MYVHSIFAIFVFSSSPLSTTKNKQKGVLWSFLLLQILKECFESQDVSKLQDAIRALPESEARYHMKRCVDSGLWVPSKEDDKTSQEDGFVKKDDDDEEGGQVFKSGFTWL